jgi:hypothetical protein
MGIFSLVLFQQQDENQDDEGDKQDDADKCQALRDEGVSLVAKVVVFLYHFCHVGWNQAPSISVSYPGQGRASVSRGVEPCPDRGCLEAMKTGRFLCHVVILKARRRIVRLPCRDLPCGRVLPMRQSSRSHSRKSRNNKGLQSSLAALSPSEQASALG